MSSYYAPLFALKAFIRSPLFPAHAPVEVVAILRSFIIQAIRAMSHHCRYERYYRPLIFRRYYVPSATAGEGVINPTHACLRQRQPPAVRG